MAKRRSKQQNAQLSDSQAQHSSRLMLWLGLTGVGALSAALGALLVATLSSTPLLQHKLRPEEEAVFGQQRLSKSMLGVPEINRSVNILVLGMSVLPDDLGKSATEVRHIGYEPQMHSVEGLSDTMQLLRFDSDTHKLTILSIPRDTRVELENHGIQKINAANIIGGPALAAKEVSKLLEGVKIDRYVRVNVLAVGQIVDAIGGLTIYVPKDMNYSDESQHLYVNLKKGLQHLNGDQTMQLLRFRHDDAGDIGRIQRQQLVIKALMAQALNPSTIARIPKLLETIKSDIDTNMSVEELMALVGFAAKTNRNQVIGLMVPGIPNGDGRHDISYWLPDHQRIQAMMGQYFGLDYAGSLAVDNANIRVSIQDGSDNPQVVKALVKRLHQAGYPKVVVSSPMPEPLMVTQIIAQQGDTESASKIYQAIGFGEVHAATSGTLYSDVTIQLGHDGWQFLTKVERANTY